MKRLLLFFIILTSTYFSTAQKADKNADKWVDSVFKTLSPDEKIAQLMVVRMSSPGTNGAIFYDSLVEILVSKYNIGGICLFQGRPEEQAKRINHFQSISKTPIMFCVDGEWGLGMRFEGVKPLYHQMMLGAVQDPAIAFQYGKIVGEQCKRIGIQVNYAPVVDINNNPDNPVINDRSFGEDKYKVAAFGIQYMKGMQEFDVMGCAKHFPGHGDVSVDSHLDLPVINKTRAQLDSLELYPFREMFKAGVGSVMIAHLYIPAIDKTANRATSLSYNNVTKLLKKDLGYKGITFTDALEMQGVVKFFPGGEASVQSLIAGNDMLCLPGDVPGSIEKIKQAIKKRKLKWKQINAHLKKVLYAKYYQGLTAKPADISFYNLTEDLNSKIDGMNKIIAGNAITLLRNDDTASFPLITTRKQRVAYIGFGLKEDNAFTQRIRDDYKAHVYYFDYSLDSIKANANLELMKGRYDVVVIGMHNYSRRPANNFGLSNAAIMLLQNVQQQFKTITIAFGNPYAIKQICNSKVLLACYEDDSIIHQTMADILNGRIAAKGTLSVTVCDQFKFGSGIVVGKRLPSARPAELGFKEDKFQYIDSVINDGIKQQAYPGAVLLVAKDGKIAYEKSYGYLTYENKQPVYTSTMYDMASVTKIMATTLSVMKLYEEGKLDLNKTLGDYLTWVKGSNKENLLINDILLHQAGLKAWIPFFRETVDTLHGNIAGDLYSYRQTATNSIRVAQNMYMRNDWTDTMYKRMLQSELGPAGKYVYSDNDFIFLGKIVEALSGKTLDQYAKENFYDKLHLTNTGFKPRERFPLNYIAPTENEKGFRSQLLWGDVHDPGAAMFGGVAGHAGLFSNVEDLAVLSQMLLNSGSFNGQQFLKKETIDLFSAYHSDVSRRGYGFDKPEKDNATRKDPYPCLSASPETIGHTGFTGTCVWIDPKYHLVYIFLSNRVHPLGGDNNKLSRMNIRTKVQEALYEALGVTK